MFTTKYFAKHLVEKKGKPSLIFPKIVASQTHNLWKTIYYPNHWVIVTNAQHNVYFA